MHTVSIEVSFAFQQSDDLGSEIAKYKAVSRMRYKVLDMISFVCLAHLVEKIVRLAIDAHTRVWDKKQITREKIARVDLVDLAKEIVEDEGEARMEWVVVDRDKRVVI